MRFISFFMMSLVFISCGKKSNSSGQKSNFEIQEAAEVDKNKDSDFDGLSDVEELELGTNPNIADLPSVTIESVRDLKFVNQFFTRSENTNEKIFMSFSKAPNNSIQRLRAEAARMAYGKMYNTDEVLKINSLTKLNKIELRCFTQAEAKRVIPKLRSFTEKLEFKNNMLNFDFKTKFKKKKGLNEISNLNFILFLNNTFMSHYKVNRDVFNFRTQNYAFEEEQRVNIIGEKNIESSSFYEFHNCVETEVKDFDYNFFDNKFSYKLTHEKVEAGLSHIVIIQKGNLQRYSVNPSFYNMDKLLKELKANPYYGHDGQLVKAFGKGNEFKSLENLNLEKKKDLNKRRWFFINEDGNRIIEELKAGEVYFLANLSALDIMNSEVAIETKNINHGYNLVLKNMYVGDKVVIKSKLKGHLILPPEKKYKVDGFVDGGFFRAGPLKNACQIHEYNRVVKKKTDLHSEAPFVAVIGEKNPRVVTSDIINEDLIFEFVINEDDIKNGVLKINLPEKSKAKFPFTRMIHRKDVSRELVCVKKKKVSTNKTDAVDQKAHKKFLYNSVITRRGIHRN